MDELIEMALTHSGSANYRNKEPWVKEFVRRAAEQPSQMRGVNRGDNGIIGGNPKANPTPQRS